MRRAYRIFIIICSALLLLSLFVINFIAGKYYTTPEEATINAGMGYEVITSVICDDESVVFYLDKSDGGDLGLSLLKLENIKGKNVWKKKGSLQLPLKNQKDIRELSVPYSVFPKFDEQIFFHINQIHYEVRLQNDDQLPAYIIQSDYKVNDFTCGNKKYRLYYW